MDGLSGIERSYSINDSYPEVALELISGKRFKIWKGFAYTSDDGESWVKKGRVNPYPDDISLMLFEDIPIQVMHGSHRGRIIAPHYLEMDGDHPDHTRESYGGHAVWKGRRRLIETHTYVPEMAGSYICFSDDEGCTWDKSKGFLMGYFEDGHQGHWSCEEPVVAELSNGLLLCLMRSTTGRLLKSYSSDGGTYWSKVEATDIACSNSPAMLKTVPGTGDLVLVWNQVTADEIREGYRRGRLSVAVSKDDGGKWECHKTLELVSGLDKAEKVETGPLQAMVRGPVDKGTLPDDFLYYDYPDIYFKNGCISISYRIGTIDGDSVIKTVIKPVSWLYE